MNTQKRLFPILVSVIAVILFAIILVATFTTSRSYAEALDSAHENESARNATTRGIYTSLSISINGGNGKVWTTVKNDVTIFPSTVIVIVELYSSETYQESYQNMTLEQKVQTGDLNLGKTITAKASTGGVQKYWLGRTRYKVDNGAWKEMKTGVCIYDANGNFVSVA